VTYNSAYTREIIVTAADDVGTVECLTGTGASIQYMENDGAMVLFSTAYPGGSCTLDITEVDGTVFHGTYTATVTTQDGSAERVLTQGVYQRL
jgi:hypothetical protein